MVSLGSSAIRSPICIKFALVSACRFLLFARGLLSLDKAGEDISTWRVVVVSAQQFVTAIMQMPPPSNLRPVLLGWWSAAKMEVRSGGHRMSHLQH